MNLWLSVIDQGTGISLPIGTSLDGVPICEWFFIFPLLLLLARVFGQEFHNLYKEITNPCHSCLMNLLFVRAPYSGI